MAKIVFSLDPAMQFFHSSEYNLRNIAVMTTKS